jgi:hypothetical protein
LAITGRSPRDDEDRAGYERLLEELRAGFTLVPHSRDTPAADEPAQSFDPVLDKGLLFEARVVSQADDVDGLVSATGEPAFDAVLSVHPFRNVVPGHPDVWKAGDSSNGWIYVGVGTGRLSSGKSHKDAGPGQTSAPIAASTLRVYALHHVAATYQFIGNHQYKQTG